MKFPKDFYWGVATSSHQVEGGNVNDWSEWEKKNAEKLAQEAEKKFSHLKNWQEIKEQAQNPQNYISGRACDHYNRYEEDFDIAKSLGHNAHRFSIEWSRIEPEEGKWDEKEIEHYREVIKALRSRGIEPFVTLWHWTLPIWLSKKGGWLNENSPKYFERYCSKIINSYDSNLVRFWITLNEPEIYATLSYLTGVWPPQKKNLFSYFRVIGNLIKAHKKACEAIKKINSEVRIGIAKNNVYFEAYRGGFINKIFKKIIYWWWNFYFLNQISDAQDFIGLNHYFHNTIKFSLLKSPKNWFNQNENKKISDIGWELYPEGIYYVLKDLKKYQKPIYIMENGLADAKDENREWFIKESLKNVVKAISKGVNVNGYLYWSLLDNFEWEKGFWSRFGLVEIDYSASGGKTLERKIRPSAYEYAKIIKDNYLDI